MHTPVLERELIEALNPQPKENFIDCTIGEGGHAEKILERTASEQDLTEGGILLGIEWDEELHKIASNALEKFGERQILVNNNYCNISQIKKEHCPSLSIKGIYFDLGVCFWHYQCAGSGFSFQEDNSLDMRFNKRNDLKAIDILNNYSAEKLAKIFKHYGEISFSNQLAKKIIQDRHRKKIETTKDLTKIILKVIPGSLRGKKKTIFSKVFQSLRIEVNQELENLKTALKQTDKILEKNGILAVISYHSLEDRIVKNFLRNNSNFKNLTKKPIIPTHLEKRFNPSAKSAKLRVACLK